MFQNFVVVDQIVYDFIFNVKAFILVHRCKFTGEQFVIRLPAV